MTLTSHVLGDPDGSTQQVISAGHEFISKLYQSKHYPITMVRPRYEDTLKIKSLPPTDIALVKHIEKGPNNDLEVSVIHLM